MSAAVFCLLLMPDPFFHSARPMPPSDAGNHSPLAGCAILIAALVVMVFLIVISTASLFRQSSEIIKFTAEQPVPIPLAPLEAQQTELAGLTARLATFRQQLDGKQRATLALTAGELNLAIAAYEPFKDLRGTLRVTGIGDGAMRLAISFRLNGKPRLAHPDERGWIAADPRFLNGTLVSRPALLNHELVLTLDTIEVSGAMVPREFIEQMSPYRITERYLSDKMLGPAMAGLTRVGIADGKLVLERVPGETPADVIGKEQVDSAGHRLFTTLGIAACVFLACAGIVAFSARRAKRRRSAGV